MKKQVQNEELEKNQSPIDDIVEYISDSIKDEEGNDFIPWVMYPSEADYEHEGLLIHQVKYDVYIYGPIVEPFIYARLFQILRNATDTDIVVLHINTPGGSINTLTAFINILKETPAFVYCTNDGFAESAGAILLFSGDDVFIPEHSIVLFHNMRMSTAFQDTGLLKNNIDSNQVLYNNLLKEFCAKVLTSAEMKAITTKGYELSLTGKELNKRLKTT